MGNLDKLSMFISLVLRHKPEAAGITLDEHGWARVDELLAGPPEFLYHGTAGRFLNSIMREGLKPMSRLYVHLSGDAETARKVGRRHGSPVLLRISSGDMHRVGRRFYLSENGVWLTEKVESKYFERVND